ncbi:uncharacterized membrane protein YgdD (TMEM256/DUF423 family) [Scopulibacillus daqui]|uniref:Uncharacterized membrane protein YgdD (TMEM256/DUF423 family) n=1 Tax=Scopulibacillus daqui TaxID=1469162 RepID=A0ABS2PZG4_9BACL|nr:DUF423 domain-containing protein [Scopulibacillus daqui]MBM7645422.1 uncharacterized membrane protein YgdD (TMEM256/DUF423 family) [Scopulibacillus daqui]
MSKLFIILGSALAFLSVALGAFGAHILKAKIGEQHLSVFETGVQYQMMHAIGLIIVGILSMTAFQGQSSLLNWAGWIMLIGIILFSGSLYMLSTTQISAFGPITPIGGVAFLVSWLLVIIAFIKG